MYFIILKSLSVYQNSENSPELYIVDSINNLNHYVDMYDVFFFVGFAHVTTHNHHQDLLGSRCQRRTLLSERPFAKESAGCDGIAATFPHKFEDLFSS